MCDCDEELRVEPVEGCYKLHETPWLEEYPDNIPTDIFEVRFKNTRKGIYRNASGQNSAGKFKHGKQQIQKKRNSYIFLCVHKILPLPG